MYNEYELNWREDILKNFTTRYKTNTVTVVWESIPQYLSNHCMEEVFNEIQEVHDYKPINWTICANVVYLTFQRKPSQGRMETLQKACYDKRI